MNTEIERRYWFHAKRYGWGWGFPDTWQGWVVLAVYMAGILGDAAAFPPHRWPGAFVANAAGLTILLTIVMLLTGEPPRWRWGNKDEGKKR